MNIYPLVEIERIEFRRIVVKERPNNLAAERVPQDIDAMLAAIEATGKLFPIETTEQGVRIIGHVK